MNAPKHTPGPWQLETFADGRSRGYVRCQSKLEGAKTGFAVCKMVRDGVTSEQYEANANLIAAAPELLAALKAFVEPWNIGGPDWESKINYQTYNTARAIIAKATEAA